MICTRSVASLNPLLCYSSLSEAHTTKESSSGWNPCFTLAFELKADGTFSGIRREVPPGTTNTQSLEIEGMPPPPRQLTILKGVWILCRCLADSSLRTYLNFASEDGLAERSIDVTDCQQVWNPNFFWLNRI